MELVLLGVTAAPFLALLRLLLCFLLLRFGDHGGGTSQEAEEEETQESEEAAQEEGECGFVISSVAQGRVSLEPWTAAASLSTAPGPWLLIALFAFVWTAW
jgi:hypothetical protein